MEVVEIQVIVLGGSFAALQTSHHLLRNVLPRLSLGSKSGEKRHKLTIITPNTHAMWKPGIPRTLVSEEIKPVDDLFLPISDAFLQYGERFELVRGEAVGVDEIGRSVSVRLEGGEDTAVYGYEVLVIATGTASPTPLWSLHGSHEHTVQAIRNLRGSLEDAKTILVGGGGPVGVETAGELAYHLKDRKICLLSGTDRLLKKLRPSLQKEAEAHLSRLNVELIHNLKVVEVIQMQDQTEVRLSDGTRREVDVFIDATGMTPNSSFLPDEWLTESGYVNVDVQTLRVYKSQGAVYAIGDIAAFSRHSIKETTDPVKALGSSIFEDFKQADAKAMKLVTYTHDDREFLVVPIGPRGGVGAWFGWRLPSIAVGIGKGRTYLWEKFKPIIHGIAF